MQGPWGRVDPGQALCPYTQLRCLGAKRGRHRPAPVHTPNAERVFGVALKGRGPPHPGKPASGRNSPCRCPPGRPWPRSGSAGRVPHLPSSPLPDRHQLFLSRSLSMAERRRQSSAASIRANTAGQNLVLPAKKHVGSRYAARARRSGWYLLGCSTQPVI